MTEPTTPATAAQRAALLGASALPDLAAIGAFTALALTHSIDGHTAGAFILTVLAGRLWPRPPSPPPGGGGAPPPGSGIGTLAAGLGLALIAGASRVARFRTLEIHP